MPRCCCTYAHQVRMVPPATLLGVQPCSKCVMVSGRAACLYCSEHNTDSFIVHHALFAAANFILCHAGNNL